MKSALAGLQRVGGALMLPIAVLPIAGLLLRLGQPDLLDFASMAAAGSAIFDNLGLLFAIGVAVGLARENHGAAGLASVVGYLVATQGAQVLIVVPHEALAGLSGQAQDLAAAAYKARELGKLSVPAGILSGLIAGALYNRFCDIRLPSYLAFFGGRRFVPIAAGLAGLGLAALFGWEWQSLETGMDAVSRSVLHAGAVGLFAYGVLNRVLIVTGLHHIINNIAWFLLGDYHGVTGDLKRFFAGDPSAGAFMAGFFPVMMFGLPAACLAMYHTARPERRKAVGGLLGSIAFTSILTGVTEPIEFTFLFLAPALYAIHAILTGLAFVIMNALQVRLGFGFSAGLFDYVLNFSKATHPWLLFPIGLVYFALYYGLFRFAIVRFNLKTPGREAAEALVAEGDAVRRPTGSEHAWSFIHALGGSANIRSVDACTTRLRLSVDSQSSVDEGALKRLGARGVVRPSAGTLQVVVGPTADQLAGDIRKALGSPPPAPAPAPARGTLEAPQPFEAALSVGELALQAVGTPSTAPPSQATESPAEVSVQDLLTALGGRANIRAIELASTRVRVNVADSSLVDQQAVGLLGLRGIAMPTAHWVHLLIGSAAEATARKLRSAAALQGG
jgi:N-acetylglucosamine PTS system EIICBA or EIICB component